MTNNVKVTSVAWSYDHGFIAVGGEDGIVRTVKVDPAGGVSSSHQASKNISVNQELAGHKSPIAMCIWNEIHQKLTTCDEHGLIIVWVLYKSLWVEEMVNDRQEDASVTGLSWSPDGSLIAILYEDGAMIIGSVEGQRVWGKDHKCRCQGIQWSPDSRLLLVGTNDAIIVYDDKGHNTGKVPIMTTSRLHSIQWNPFNLNGSSSFPDIPSLAISFYDGKIQLMRNECDPNPIFIDSCLSSITYMEWNYSGSILAVCGRTPLKGTRGETTTESSAASGKSNIMVKFLSPHGHLLHSLKLPGKEINSLSWERDGLRLVLGIDGYVYFSNIRPQYLWVHFSDTIAFASPQSDAYAHRFLSDERATEHISSDLTSRLVFWSMKSNEKSIKPVTNLLSLSARGQLCSVVTRNSLTTLSSTITLCNAIGTSLDSIVVDILVTASCMTSSQVIVSSRGSVIIWRFPSLQSAILLDDKKGNMIDDLWDDVGDIVGDIDGQSAISRGERGVDDSLQMVSVSSSDDIACISCSEKILVVGLASGDFLTYRLPKASLLRSFSLASMSTFSPSPSMKAFISFDSSRLAVIDGSSRVTIVDTESGQSLDFDKKEVWSFKWSTDDSSSFALAEKNKLFLFRDMECEESCYAAGYISSYSDLKVTCIDLDQMINTDLSTGDEDISSMTTVVETKILKDVKNLLSKEGFKKASAFIDDKLPSPVLWKFVAEHSLRALDFDSAEVAFVRCKDFKGIQFCKKVSRLSSEGMKRAEVLAYFGSFDDAEQILLSIDRRDLALSLRRLLGHHVKTLDLISDSLGTTEDSEIRQAMSLVGDYYAERMMYDKAVSFYEKAQNVNKLFETFLAMDDFDNLKQLMTKYDVSNPSQLMSFASAFESVGMVAEAVDAYLKAGSATEAIRCCISLNEWKTALPLAQEYDISDTDTLLSKYASHLLSKGKYVDIIELYKKANRLHDASSMIIKTIQEVEKNYSQAGCSSCPPAQTLKKLYCLIGIVHWEAQRGEKRGRGFTHQAMMRRNTLTSLLRDDDTLVSASVNFRALDAPWRGVEAYHFLLLAHQHLYGNNGNNTVSIDDAMKCSLRLMDYEDILNVEDIYILIALTSCANKNFAIASRAFIKLESLSGIPEERRSRYEELATSIFARHPPKESKNLVKAECGFCASLIPDYAVVCPSCNTRFPPCVSTGRSIMEEPSAVSWSCLRCSHFVLRSELYSVTCPLCHFPVKESG